MPARCDHWSCTLAYRRLPGSIVWILYFRLLYTDYIQSEISPNFMSFPLSVRHTHIHTFTVGLGRTNSGDDIV